MTKYAVIVAGGNGTRMGSGIPKQFLDLKGRPVLWFTLETFLKTFDDLLVILVVPAQFQEQTRLLVSTTHAPERIQITLGGSTRFHSVQNGLKLIKEESVVFVHDGVRCMVTEALIRRCFDQALLKGSAIPAVPVNDSMRIRSGNTTQVLDRNLLLAIQTPQTFRSEIILPAFQQQYSEAFTDEATVAEAAGFEVCMIEGDKDNIKITLPADLLLAAQLLSQRGA